MNMVIRINKEKLDRWEAAIAATPPGLESLEFAVAAREGWPEAILAFKLADGARQNYAKTAERALRENAQLRRTLQNNIDNLHRIANVIDEDVARDLIESLIAHNAEILAADKMELIGDYAGLLKGMGGQ
jgi:sirohydrochlorin ferrochelatase